MDEFKPRKWQRLGADICVSLKKSGADRALVYACPGSGKTFGGLLIARDLISRAKLPNKLIVITPNLAIRSQWIERAKALDIHLRQVASATVLHQETLPIGVDGFILNYQQAINMKRSLRLFCENNEPIVILDEVHHTAAGVLDKDGNAWGHAVEYAFQHASFKLCTTGTPFREGSDPIAFVHYNEAGEATAQVRYTYEEAIVDGHCRPIEFEFYDGEIEWTSKSKTISASFTDKLNKKQSHERLEAALSTDGQFPSRMLAAAHEKLIEIRAGRGVDGRAGGLVVAIDVKHAEELATELEKITGQRPVVVHSKLDEAQGMIDEFRESDAPWIVGISMLSEGVDIPRLRVGVYASRVRTALYFHQFCGRFTRVQESNRERAHVFLARDPELEALAIEIEKEKYHALGEEPPKRRGGHGPGGLRRAGIDVECSDGEAVASVFGGVSFPKEYVIEHRARIQAMRERLPIFRGQPDVEVLAVLIHTGAVPPPRSAA